MRLQSINQAITDITATAQAAGITRNEADNIVWSYCAKGFRDICTSNPKCKDCVISSLCKYQNNTIQKNIVSTKKS